jgi:predicted transcriptional regulator
VEWTYDDIREYQSFTTLEELNETVREHLKYNSNSLNKTAVTVLKTISRYSCVVLGVSWLKACTLAAVIGKSERTVQRALKMLESAGIIKRVPRYKNGGGRTSDISIIQTCRVNLSYMVDVENASESKVKEGFELEETNTKTKIIRKDDLDNTYVSDSVPQEFTKLVRCYWDSAKTIEEFWRMAKIACNKAYDDYALLDVALHSFRQMVGKLKSGAIRKKPIAYYFGVLNAKLDDLYYDELHEMGFGKNE